MVVIPRPVPPYIAVLRAPPTRVPACRVFVQYNTVHTRSLAGHDRHESSDISDIQTSTEHIRSLVKAH